MRILIASDHAGLDRKNQVVRFLKSKYPSFEVEDFGPFDSESVDYPDFANKVCSNIPALTHSMTALTPVPAVFGVLICGSGQGMAMRANKFKHIKAALCWNEESTVLSREHNDANVLCLGARMCDEKLSCQLVDKFITASFAQGRHSRRVVKMLSPV